MRVGASDPALMGMVPRWLWRPLIGGMILPMILAFPALAPPLFAQVVPTSSPHALSLEEALRLALGASEEVAIARGGLTSARGQRITARAARLPQITTSYYYNRTLISQFSGAGRRDGGGADTIPLPPPCSAFRPDTTLPLAERVHLLEEALGCAPLTPGFDLDFGEFGFGQKNTHGFGASLYQPIYLGGQIRAQNELADAALRTAELEVTAQDAQLVVTVTEAYYDALLSARLLTIAEESLERAEETLRFTELGFEVGEQAEYDVLRARVARDIQRNNLIQRRSARDIAFLNLKQRLDLPADEVIVLTTGLESGPGEAVILPDWIESAPDTATELRVPVRQAAEAVSMQEAQVDLARAQGRPTVAFVSDYGLISYPANVLPLPSDFRHNWTVGIQVSYPLFTGGRIRGGIVQAQGALEQAEARLRQTRKVAALDTRTKLEALATARAALASTTGTVEEASRAYEIALLRYQQDLANLTEVGDARLALSQAEVDRAEALRSLHVAEVQLLLIEDLPLGGGTTPGVGGVPGMGGTPGMGGASGTRPTGTTTTGTSPTTLPSSGLPQTGPPIANPPTGSAPAGTGTGGGSPGSNPPLPAEAVDDTETR